MSKSNQIIEEAIQLMEQHEPDPDHVIQVRTLAVSLFQQLQSIHKLQKYDLTLLEAATLLHDTGWSRSPDGKAHHKHSAQLIREHRWESLRSDQVDLVAQVARYHRKAIPSDKHKRFRSLPLTLKTKVTSMSALIRLADGLDRSHQQNVDRLGCEITPGCCRILIHCHQNPAQEIQGFAKKKDLFENHFSTKLELTHRQVAGSQKASK